METMLHRTEQPTYREMAAVTLVSLDEWSACWSANASQDTSDASSAGDRHKVNAYQAQREIVIEFLACDDCVYYAAYGQLPTD